MRLFENRLQAANELAGHLAYLQDQKPIVLGLANSGVLIADVVARRLKAPMDVLLIETLTAPNVPGQVVGAVDEHGRISLIQASARWHHLNTQQLVEPARHAFRMLQGLHVRLRSLLPEADVKGRTVIVVGEAVITGARMLSAIAALRNRGAAKIIVATPAGIDRAIWQLHDAADLVVIPHRPAKFKGVQHLYEQYVEVSDETMLRVVEQNVTQQNIAAKSVRSVAMRFVGTCGQPLMCEVDLPPGATRGSGPYPAVVFAHGFESDGRSIRSVTISKRLAKRGIIGVRMDFTGHGRSGGTIDDATDMQMLADLHVVFQHVMALTEVDAGRMGIVGSGTGAMIALYYAAQVPAVRAMVIRGPVCGRETLAARHVQASTLIIHAERDTALFDSVQTLDRELAAQHRLLRIPNSNRLFGDPISFETMVNATVDWLMDHLVVEAHLSSASSDAGSDAGESIRATADAATSQSGSSS